MYAVDCWKEVTTKYGISRAEQELKAIAFQTAISKFENSKNEFSSVSSALSFVDSKVTNIKNGSDVVEQSLVSEKSGLYKSKYTKKTISSKGVTKEEVYTFFWDHLDGNFINVNVSGNSLYLILKTRGNKKFISHSINEKTQALDNEIKIELRILSFYTREKPHTD